MLAACPGQPLPADSGAPVEVDHHLSDPVAKPSPAATTDPAAYVRALSRATQAAELTAPAGLGDFWWIIATR